MAKKRAADDGIRLPVYEPADVGAMKALVAGNANAIQQKRALDWIINQASGYYDLSYRPGADGERATTFAEGRRFVGAEIIRLTKLILNPTAK